LNCPLCDSDQIEKMEKGFLCKNCGIGVPHLKTPFNKTDFIKLTFETVVLFKELNPNATHEQLTDIVMKFLHKDQKHPVRPDGYCEFCEKVIK